MIALPQMQMRYHTSLAFAAPYCRSAPIPAQRTRSARKIRSRVHSLVCLLGPAQRQRPAGVATRIGSRIFAATWSVSRVERWKHCSRPNTPLRRNKCLFLRPLFTQASLVPTPTQTTGPVVSGASNHPGKPHHFEGDPISTPLTRCQRPSTTIPSFVPFHHARCL